MKMKLSNKIILFVTLYCTYILTFHGASCQEEYYESDELESTSRRLKPCMTILKTEGVCVNLQNCKPMKEAVEERPDLAERLIGQSLCSQNRYGFRVCCPAEAVNNDSNVNEKEKKPPTSAVSSNKPLTPPQCGKSNVPHDRVVGGTPAALGAWPWIALLGYGSTSRVSFRCGGTLISSRHVVTAAHCVKGVNNLRVVRLGEHKLQSDNDGANPIDFLIEKATVHPNYDSETTENDIAILKLKNDVSFTDQIQPICLPVADDIKNYNFVHHYPFIAGWGATSFKGQPSTILRETQIPVVDEAQCKSAYRVVINTVIDNRVLCAGYPQGGKDSCQGDSGGPLMFPYKNSYYLIGVVSGGYGCGEPGFPGLYTRVTSFLDFIQSNMN